MVGCAIDLDGQSLTWYKNGEPAFVGNCGLEFVSGGQLVNGPDDVIRVSLVGEEFELIPACCLYSASDAKLAKVSFNFAGKMSGKAFSGLPAGHDPYGGTD